MNHSEERKCTVYFTITPRCTLSTLNHRKDYCPDEPDRSMITSAALHDVSFQACDFSLYSGTRLQSCHLLPLTHNQLIFHSLDSPGTNSNGLEKRAASIPLHSTLQSIPIKFKFFFFFFFEILRCFLSSNPLSQKCSLTNWENIF